MAAALIGLLAGCATQRVEPQPLPKSQSYRMEDRALKQLSGLVVRLDLECISKAILSWGGTLESFEFRNLIEREFSNFLRDNDFKPAGEGIKEHVVLRVTPSSQTIRGKSHVFSDDTVDADFTFIVELTPPLADESGQGFWKNEYNANSETVDRDKRFIPECVYKAIMKSVVRFKDDLESTQSVLDFLEQRIHDNKELYKLSGFDPKWSAGEKGFRASVKCAMQNVRKDKGEALSWAKNQIRFKCKEQFGTDDFKVFYTEQAFDEKVGAWDIILYACRAGEVVDGMAFFHDKGERNGMGERGLCIVDREFVRADDIDRALGRVRERLFKDFRVDPNFRTANLEKPTVNALSGALLVPYSIVFF